MIKVCEKRGDEEIVKGFKRLEDLGSVMRTHDVVLFLSLLFLCRVM